jgi:anti-anti-sigma factor
MTNRDRAVTVRQLPETLNEKQDKLFLLEIQHCMESGRPRIVIDCSSVRKLDSSLIHLLLCCLEEAMKRNGDVKLAALPADPANSLELTGVTRLFDIYDTPAEAVDSFHSHSAKGPKKAAGRHSNVKPESVL